MDKVTLDTYNKSAGNLSKYFSGINGTTSQDIERAFKLVNKPSASVFEIGCGNGRDAVEITQKTDDYTGMDYSESMIKLVQKISKAKFIVADIRTYKFSRKYDIIYAFASLLHMNRNDVKKVLAKSADALNAGGVISISLKKDTYQMRVQTNQFGTRVFYYYEPKDIEELAPSNLKTAYIDFQKRDSTDWFTIALQKK